MQGVDGLSLQELSYALSNIQYLSMPDDHHAHPPTIKLAASGMYVRFLTSSVFVSPLYQLVDCRDYYGEDSVSRSLQAIGV